MDRPKLPHRLAHLFERAQPQPQPTPASPDVQPAQDPQQALIRRLERRGYECVSGDAPTVYYADAVTGLVYRVTPTGLKKQKCLKTADRNRYCRLRGLRNPQGKPWYLDLTQRYQDGVLVWMYVTETTIRERIAYWHAARHAAP